ncbi:hypothetical protein IMY05_C4922000300 [Salix suchowensis]|nr:hypothetical protein IMY05_C4922000300 [Salix suchowensis]
MHLLQDPISSPRLNTCLKTQCSSPRPKHLHRGPTLLLQRGPTHRPFRDPTTTRSTAECTRTEAERPPAQRPNTPPPQRPIPNLARSLQPTSVAPSQMGRQNERSQRRAVRSRVLSARHTLLIWWYRRNKLIDTWWCHPSYHKGRRPRNSRSLIRLTVAGPILPTNSTGLTFEDEAKWLGKVDQLLAEGTYDGHNFIVFRGVTDKSRLDATNFAEQLYAVMGKDKVAECEALVRDKLELVIREDRFGILHTDVQPGNILWDMAATDPTLIDWGRAKDLEWVVYVLSLALVVRRPWLMLKLPSQWSAEIEADVRKQASTRT